MKSFDEQGEPVFLSWLVVIMIAGALVIGGIWGLHALSRSYGVWSAMMVGKAELAQADYNRQIQVVEAQAKQDSAVKLAQAEIERAKGVAKANEIIGDSLKNNDAYLRYLWIQGLQTNQMMTIYVPTEANLPILEAGRLQDMYNKAQ